MSGNLFSKRGRNSFRKSVSVFVLVILLGNGFLSSVALANQIVLDNKTETFVSTDGNVTNITTGTVAGANALNSFRQFDVSEGKVVNLHLPEGTNNLLNLVHDRSSNISGILNSIRDGKIGGNVYFLNPHGIVVGETGQINVGSLTLLTPTTTFMDNFFSNSGVHNPELLQRVLDGRVPIGQSGLLSVQGKINALEDVTLMAATVNLGGEILTGAVFTHEAPGFSDVVNVRDYSEPKAVELEDGKIRIEATQIHGSGTTLKTDGSVTMEAKSGGQALIHLQNSDIQARDVSLEATSTISKSGLVANDVSADAAVTLDSTRIQATGNLNLHAQANVAIETTSPTLDFLDLPADAGAAISIIDSSAVVTVEGASKLNVNGDLSMTAENRVDVTSKSDASDAKGSTAVGGSVAVSKVTTTTEVAVNGSTEIVAGTLNVSALSDNRLETESKAATQGAKKNEGSQKGKTEEQLDAYGEHAQTSEGGVEVAASLAISDLKSNTGVRLGSTGNIAVSGDVNLLSQVRNQSAVFADASTVQEGSVGVGVAVGINLAETSNQVVVNQTLNASSLNMKAITLDDGDGASMFETKATSGAGSANVGVAGALGVNVIETDTAAQLGGVVTLSDGLEIWAGNTSGSQVVVAPHEDVAANQSVGVGASVAVNVATNNVRAEVADGAQVSGVKELTVIVKGDHTTSTEATAGSAGGISVTPVVAVSAAKNSVVARLGTSSYLLTLNGDLLVSAQNVGKTTTKAEGSSEGETAAIGAAIAVNVVEDTASALVNRHVTATGDVQLRATNDNTGEAHAVAGAKGGKEQDDSTPDDGVDQDISKQVDFARNKQGSSAGDTQVESAQTDEGKLSVAAAVSVNVVDSKAEAGVSDGVTINAGATLGIETENASHTTATADGSSADGTAQVGVGAAVAINQVDSSNSAYLGQGTHQAGSLTITATTPSSESNVEATAGAGSSKVGVAGAVGINVIDNTVDARINPSANITMAGGDVTVTAQNDASHTAKAAPAGDGASGGTLGVGASVAVNTISEQVTAEISAGSKLTGAKDVSVSASSNSDSETSAQAGAEGGIAIDAAVAVTTLNQSTRAILAGGDLLTTTGNVDVSSASNGSHQATATGETKSEKVGMGAAVAVIVSNSSVSEEGDRVETDRPVAESVIDRDVDAGGDVSVTASADRSYEATGTASAKGAAADADQKGKSKSMDTLSENKDSQKGTQGGGTVTVAAAVGVTYLNDDVRATITGGSSGARRNLTVGGDLTVSALNASNFTSQGNGSAADGQSKVGIGVGVGLSIQRSDALASLGDYTTIRAQDLKVSAKSQHNRDSAFVNKLAAEGIAGASAANVGVAGALAVVDSASKTRANIGDHLEVTEAKNISISADNTSKLAAKAWAATKGGKVGVGASVATIVSKNQYTATLGSNSQVLKSDSLRISAINHKVEGAVPFEYKDFESLNLQVLLGENNYYTEAIAGAGGSNVAVAGAFAVNVFEDEALASIGTESNVKSSGEVVVNAENATTAKALTGGVALQGKVGVGLASSDIANTSTTQSMIADHVTVESHDLKVTATAEQELGAFGVSASGADKVGVAGVANVVVSKNTVEAVVSNNAKLTQSGDVILFAKNKFNVMNIAGGAAGGGTAGIGASVATTIIKNRTLAYLDKASTASVAGTTAIDAWAQEDLLTIAAGGAGGGKAGVAGSSVVNTLNSSTHAYIGAGSKVNESPSGLAGQNVFIRAKDETDMISVAGAAAFGGTAGVGAAADVAVINKDTQAYIASSVGEKTIVNAGNTVGISADARENITSVAAGFAGGGTAGVAGTAAVYTIDNTTRSYIGEYAKVKTSGNVLVSALNTNKLLTVSGSAAGSGTASVGGSGAVVVSNRLTEAYIASFADVSALGKHTGIDAHTGEFTEEYKDVVDGDGKVERPAYQASDLTGDGTKDTIDNESLTKERTATANTTEVRGVAVTAVTQDHLEAAAVGGAASGTVAVTGAGAVSVIENNTTAEIRSNAKINQTGETGDDQQGVLVAAGTDYYSLGIGGAVSGSGSVAVGPGTNVSVVELNTLAAIGHDSEVTSKGDITVSAKTSEDILAIAAAGSASVYAAISGAVTVNSLTSKTHAFIGDRAKVLADKSLTLSSLDQTKYTTIAGGVGLAVMGGGVGGSVAVNVINKDTQSYVGQGADIKVREGLRLHAQSSEDLLDVVASGGIGVFAGAAGAVVVNTVNSNTYAYVKENAQINKDFLGASANQRVDILAQNDLNLLSIAGTMAGGAVGVSGGVDVATIKNNTAAYVQDGVALQAKGALNIEAQSTQEIESFAVSAGAGSVGVAGGVSVVSVGSDLELDSKKVDGKAASSALETSDGSGNVHTYADGQISGNVADQLLSGYEDTNIQAARTDLNAKTSTLSTQSSGGSAPVGGTQALIGEGATIQVGTLELEAKTDLALTQAAGGAAGGTMGAGGAVSIATLNANTNTSVGQNTTIQTTGEAKIRAELGQKYDGYSVAGAVGYAGTLAGSLVYLDDRSSTYATLNQDSSLATGSLLLSAKAERDNSLLGVGASAALSGPALSGTVVIGKVHGKTQALVGERTEIDSGTGTLTVEAQNDSELTGTGVAPAAGLLAGLGAAVTMLEDSSEVTASIENNAEITKAGAVNVLATYRPKISGHTTGGGAGLVAVGASITDIKINGTVQASVGEGVQVGQKAGSSVTSLRIASTFGRADDLDTAEATTLGGAVGAVAGAGSDAKVLVAPTIRALIGQSAKIKVNGDVMLRALSTSGAKAKSVGVTGAAVGVGLSFAKANLTPSITASVGNSVNIVATGDVQVAALHNFKDDGTKVGGSAQAEAYAATGAHLVGANGSKADAEASAEVVSSVSQSAIGIEGADVKVVSRSSNESNAQAEGVTLAGVVASGAALANSSTQGTTDAHVDARVASSGSLSILAESNEQAKATTKSGAGAIVAGSGSIATARAQSATRAYTGTGVSLSATSGTVSIKGETTSGAEAKALGVNAGGLAVGVSMATAENRPTVSAYLGSNSFVFSKNLVIQARSLAGRGTLADSSASSGGLVGVNATSSVATNTTNVTSYVGANSGVRATNEVNILAEGNTLQEAESTANTGGIVAAGANSSEAKSHSTVQAYIGDDVTVSGDKVVIDAKGKDTNYAESVAGTGGVVAGSAARASTTSGGLTSASIGERTQIQRESTPVSSLEINASHTVDFNAKTDSTSAALLGASGAYATNAVDYAVKTMVGDEALVKAKDLRILAQNTIVKNALSGYNVQSGSGGVVGAAASRSHTSIKVGTQITLGEKAQLAVVGDRKNPGIFIIEGLNDVKAYDRVKLDAGGAISVARAESKIENNTNNVVLQIGKGANLSSVGDIDFSVLSKTHIETANNVKTYGGAGAAQGYSLSQSNAQASITVGQDVKMVAYNDTNLRVGSNRSGVKGNQTILANTDLWNKTALPIETKPDADAYLTQTNNIVLNTGSHLQSVGDLRLLTDGGSRNVRGYGVGKDLYREVLQAIGQFFSDLVGGGDVSLEIKSGRSKDTLSTGVRVDGIAEVGIENKRYLTIGEDGTVDASRSSEGYTVTRKAENLSNDIQERIAELDGLIAALDAKVTDSHSETTDPRVAEEIAELEYERTATNSTILGVGEDIDYYVTINAEKQNSIEANNRNIDQMKTILEQLQEDPEENEDKIAQYLEQIEVAEANNVTWAAEIAINNEKITGFTDALVEMQVRINEINRRLQELADLNVSDSGSDIASLADKYRAEKAMLLANLGSLGDTSNLQVLTVDQEIVAKSSNIYAVADNLTGSGQLKAPGDALIEVRNESPHFLRTGTMTIPDEAGGRIFFNQISVGSVADINARNKNGTAQFTNVVTTDNTTSKISVINAYTPTGGQRAPDLLVDGDVRNLAGLVQLTSVFGSVQIKDGVDVVADTIRITAGRDITIGYKDGFRNIGGDIHQAWSQIIANAEARKQDWSTRDTVDKLIAISNQPSLLAGNNIFVSGQYLNINGIIQSGLPTRTVVIPKSVEAEIAVFKSDYAADASKKIRALSINSQLESDISKIAVFYDAEEDVLYVDPLYTMGGYVELYGHIMNTGNGEIRAMDGYSHIEIDNQTGTALRVRDINTGNGIHGTIKITDTGQKAHGGGALQTVIKREGDTVYTYSNEATGTLDLVTAVTQTAGRQTQYNPLANQYYSWTVKDELSWTEERTEYHERWFGFKTRDKTSYSGISSYNEKLQRPVGAAVLRTVDGKTDTYWYDRTLYHYAGAWSQGSWRTVENVLYVYMKEERDNTRSVRQDIFHNHNIAAFHPIKIEFLGFDQGQLDVTSVGDIIIDGALRNTLGATKLRSTQGSILQTQTEFAGIVGQNIDLTAEAGIGNAEQGVGLQFVNDGFVNATVTSGDLYLEAKRGNLVFSDIVANDGNVSLGADTGIYGKDASALVKGNVVNVQVAHGDVGTAENHLRVDTLSTTAGGLNVLAAGDVHITEISGDLYVNSVESQGGDVVLTTLSGSILDNNTNETIDTRAKEELLGLWSDMALTGEQAKTSALHAVEAYERMRTREYKDYWQLRERQTGENGSMLGGEAYHPDARVTLTADEKAYYLDSLGWTEEQVGDLEAKMTSDLHALHAIYGSVSDTYNDSWTYVVVKPQDGSGNTMYESYDENTYGEWHSLIAGFSWTQEQLENSMGIGVLKETADTRVRIEDPNVTGRHVSLESSANIGQSMPNQSIKLDGRKWTDLTEEEKLMILTAENKDITIVSDNEIRIAPKEDLNLRASGAIQAKAAGDIFLGSEEDMALALIEAGGDVRIKSRQNIFGAAPEGEAVITGQDLLLEAARGSIGTDSRALVINIGASNLTARAGEDIYISSPGHNLNIDTIYAHGHVDLYTGYSVLNGTNPNQNIRAGSLNLVAESGGIGDRDRSLKIGLDLTGYLTAQAGDDIFISSPVRSLNTGKITGQGDITIFGGDNVYVGSQEGGLDAQLGDVRIDAYNSIFAKDEGLGAGITAQNIYLETTAGSSGSNDADLRINSLALGKFTAKAVAGIHITETEGDLSVESAISEKGGISLTSMTGDLGVESAEAQEDITLVAETRNLDVDNVTSEQGAITMTAQGTVDVNEAVAHAGNISLTSNTSDVTLQTATAGANVTITAQNDVLVGTVTSEGGNVHLTAVTGDVPLGVVHASEGTVRVSAKGSITGQATETSITAKNIELYAATGTVGQAASPLNIDSSKSDRGHVIARAQNGVYLYEVDGDLNIQDVEAVTGDVVISADGSITGGYVKGEDITLSSTNGSIGQSNAYTRTAARGKIAAKALGSVYLERLGGDFIADQILAAQGSIGLRVPDGGIRIANLQARDGVTLRSSNDLWMGQASATDFDLTVLGTGRSLTVDKMYAVRSLGAYADHIVLPSVEHTGSEPIVVAIGGGSKPVADTVIINVKSPIGVVFAKMQAANMDLQADTDHLALTNVVVSKKATFKNRYHTVVIDNVERKIYPNVALQLYPQDRPFSLTLGADRQIWTTARAVNYNDHFIINEFGTTNSVTRITTKLAEVEGAMRQPVFGLHRISRLRNGDRPVDINNTSDEQEDKEDDLVWEPIQISSAI